ncbi:hypothetical protein ACG7TL_009262 [Trametes sanguinea]
MADPTELTRISFGRHFLNHEYCKSWVNCTRVSAGDPLGHILVVVFFLGMFYFASTDIAEHSEDPPAVPVASLSLRQDRLTAIETNLFAVDLIPSIVAEDEVV